jgi:hypothetical protein
LSRTGSFPICSRSIRERASFTGISGGTKIGFFVITRLIIMVIPPSFGNGRKGSGAGPCSALSFLGSFLLYYEPPEIANLFFPLEKPWMVVYFIERGIYAEIYL